jgi:hypothetical protein
MIKGALVEFTAAFGASLPNVVIFQFNPETVRHTWTQAPAPTTLPGQTGSNPLAVAGVPGETFSFTLTMDVGDQLTDPHPAVRAAAAASGIYARLAALEMLLFPVDTGPAAAAAGGRRQTPTAQVPTVLFVWGIGRIVPVRVTSLSITETLYDSLLNPTHADAAVELRVLTPAELRAVTGPLASLAANAYQYSQHLREGLAVANLGTAAQAVIGMLRGVLPG